MQRGRRLAAALALACLAAAGGSGCSEDLETAYGQRSAPGAAMSVNGTAVLAGMFEEAGHQVTSWSAISPRLDRADCIVWFPDDFQPPSREVRERLEQWLTKESSRTLIYVGRDFDAAPWYWEQVGPDAPEGQRELIHERRRNAEARFTSARSEIPEWEDCDWFIVQREEQSRRVRSLAGKSQWLEGIAPDRLEIELAGRIEPSQGAEVLLESDGDMLVGSKDFDESRLIVVANGSFLLNAALVNHEHRKLAGKLIDEIGAGRNVVFLESGSGGPPIRDDDPRASVPTGLEIFLVWPTNWILLHLAAVGIIFCYWRFPIFGRPRPPEPPGASDFGKHIDAVASLLRRSGDRQYAMSRVLHYQQTVRETQSLMPNPQSLAAKPQAAATQSSTPISP